MNEYVLLVRIDPAPLANDDVLSIRARWSDLLDRWKAEDRFVTSNRIVKEGVTISGSERRVVPGGLTEGGMKLVSTINLRAISWEDAVELAKECPVLDYGGAVEVRDPQQLPALAAN